MAMLADVPESGRPAFQARLRHLRQLGTPEGVNTGKGTRAIYGAKQVFQMAYAVELLMLGITPERASSIVRDFWPIIIVRAVVGALHTQPIATAFAGNVSEPSRRSEKGEVVSTGITAARNIGLADEAIDREQGISRATLDFLTSERHHLIISASNIVGAVTEYLRANHPEAFDAFIAEIKDWRHGIIT